MIEHLEDRLIEHMSNDEKVYQKIASDIEKIKDNHLAHIQGSMHSMQQDIAVVTNDVSWLKRWFWVVVTTSIGSLFTGMVSLLLKR